MYFASRILPLAVICALIASLVLSPALAADWPSWRGPTRNGPHEGIVGWTSGSWPIEEPTWTTDVGEGWTSPVVAKGRLYTLGWKDNEDHVVCLTQTLASCCGNSRIPALVTVATKSATKMHTLVRPPRPNSIQLPGYCTRSARTVIWSAGTRPPMVSVFGKSTFTTPTVCLGA